MKELKPVNTVFLLGADDTITLSVQALCGKNQIELQSFALLSEIIQKVNIILPAIVLVCVSKETGIPDELINELKNNNIFIPVIALGEENNIAAAVASIHAGAVDYIEKSSIKVRLLEYINTLAIPPQLEPPKL